MPTKEWEFRHAFFSCYIFVKFLSGRTMMLGIDGAMRIKDLNVKVMDGIREKGIDWPYDEMPRLMYCGRCLQTLPDNMFLTCAYQNLWTDATFHALPPVNTAPAGNNDEEEEEGEEEEESEEEEQAE